MFICILCICVSACIYVCALCKCPVPRRSDEGIESLGTVVKDDCEIPRGYQKPEQDSLQEHQVLLTSEASLSPILSLSVCSHTYFSSAGRSEQLLIFHLPELFHLLSLCSFEQSLALQTEHLETLLLSMPSTGITGMNHYA